MGGSYESDQILVLVGVSPTLKVFALIQSCLSTTRPVITLIGCNAVGRASRFFIFLFKKKKNLVYICWLQDLQPSQAQRSRQHASFSGRAASAVESRKSRAHSPPAQRWRTHHCQAQCPRTCCHYQQSNSRAPSGNTRRVIPSSNCPVSRLLAIPRASTTALHPLWSQM